MSKNTGHSTRKKLILTPRQMRRFLALNLVGFETYHKTDAVLYPDIEEELLTTKMIYKTDNDYKITDRGLKEITRLASMGGVYMPWSKRNEKKLPHFKEKIG